MKAFSTVAAAVFTTAASAAGLTLENRFVRLSFDEARGTFDVIDARTGELVLAHAGIGGTDAARGATWRLSKERCETAFGAGERVVATVGGSRVTQTGGFGGEMVYAYAIVAGQPFVIMSFGVDNSDWYRFRLRDASVVRAAAWCPGMRMEEPRTLNSGAGAAVTRVSADLSRCCENGIVATAIANGRRRTLVAGGLGYDAFGKYVEFVDGELALFAHDPTGVLVDQGERYRAEPDTFYLDCVTDDPFEAAELYGRAMRKANNARPKAYDFPLLCGWSVGALCKLPDVNTSTGLVSELECAAAKGLTRYTKVGVRLEPDAYQKLPGGSDTEQGWYDDEHWRRFGHLTPPYDTFAKWCRAVKDRGGIPYSYFQVGMPSRDFIERHPEWMLFNSSDGADRLERCNNPIGANYDFTDPGLQAHFRKVWSRLREAGLMGVKFDYPCSGMFPGGGFEDSRASTTKAYRDYFRLAREGLGDDAFLDERNLGYNVRPLLDQTAGLVDTQRIWGDSKDHCPEMVSRAGLRWFKNRTVFDYYTDTKALHGLSEASRRGLLTSVYLSSGRMELSTSFSLMTRETVHDLSRFFPEYREPWSARPVDAFAAPGMDPQAYLLRLSGDVCQVMLVNTRSATNELGTVAAPISGDSARTGALGLDPETRWHVHSFWSGRYFGIMGKDDVLSVRLGRMEAEMYRLTRDKGRPQVVSSTRHVFQGWVEVANETWAGNTLSGEMRHVPAGDSERLAVATAGRRVASANVPYAEEDGLVTLSLKSATGEPIPFSVTFEPIVLKEPRRALELPPGADNSRNSEGDFAVLKDGRVLYVYSHFMRGNGRDHDPAMLASRVSADGGLTWSERPRTVLPNEGGQNVMSVSLLRLKDGSLALFYLRKDSSDDCRPVMRVSRDEGETWSVAAVCVPDCERGYYTLNNCRVERLSDGRLLMPLARRAGPEDFACSLACWFSDDDGVMWRRGGEPFQTYDAEGRRVVTQEPGVVELKDGRILMYARTDRGRQWFFWSSDRGQTWTKGEPGSLCGPLSPATVKRLCNGDLVAFWNDHEAQPELTTAGPHWAKGLRTPLAIGISRDDGKTWPIRRTLESDPKGWYCYYGVMELGGNILLGYCAKDILSCSRISVVPTSWIYEPGAKPDRVAAGAGRESRLASYDKSKPWNWRPAGEGLWMTETLADADIGAIVLDRAARPVKSAFKREHKDEVVRDLDFWCDPQTHAVHMKSWRNPADRFSSIELLEDGRLTEKTRICDHEKDQ